MLTTIKLSLIAFLSFALSACVSTVEDDPYHQDHSHIFNDIQQNAGG